METFKIEAQYREQVGKKASKASRKSNMVPCIIYGGEANYACDIDYNTLRKGVYTDQFVIFEIDIKGKGVYKAIIKELQFDPVSDKMLHVDFQELVAGKKVKTEVPLITKGFSKGQQAGGKLEIKLRKVKIKAEADKIPSLIEVDVTPLDLGKSLRIRDIQADGYEILNAPSIPIVSITIPRSLRSQQAAAAAAANK